MATQKFVIVKSVYNPQSTGVNDQLNLRAVIQILLNDVMYDFEVDVIIDSQQSAAQREAALVNAISSATQNQYGFTVSAGDLLWPWFR